MANRSHGNPGYSRESKIVSVYTRATGTNVQIADNNFQSVETGSEPGVERSICLHCTGAEGNGSVGCREMHKTAIQESSSRGRPHAYQCRLGLMFWTSSLYSKGKFSGALCGSGYVDNDADKSAFARKCNGTITPEEFSRRVSALPTGDMGKIQSFAEMLQMCAEYLSTGDENYHEILKLRSEQQASLSALVEELKKKHPEGTALPVYPLDKERQLIESLFHGNKKETENFLNELLAVLVFNNPNQFRNIQLRALELAIMISRAGLNPGDSAAAENNTRYLRKIQEAKTIEEVTGTLYSIVENITGQITSFQGIPHALAMRKAEAYIKKNLTRKLTLREIAKVAGLSPPYFSTIFKDEMGENLSRYINRLRVEKSIKMLLETDFSLSDISTECCFQDQSWFSKIFKSFTGISPGKYRNQGGPTFSARNAVGK
jgi:AraC-like DNA-binding protein/ligand-binding sensor protein